MSQYFKPPDHGGTLPRGQGRGNLPHNSLMHSKYSRSEIERRWFVDLDAIGPLEDVPFRRIVDRSIHGTRLRLRRVEDDGETLYKLGQKENGRITNIYLNQAEYNLLAELPANVLVKRRYAIAGGSLDLPEGDLSPRWELEFSSVGEAEAFSPPPFVTTEDRRD